MSREESEIAEAKARLRAAGWYVRYTEWTFGHQVVIHRRSETAHHRVTEWCASEVEAWREGLSLGLGRTEAAMSIPIQEEPESTIGRKPPHRREDEETDRGRERSGAGREADEGDAGSQDRERDREEPSSRPGLTE